MKESKGKAKKEPNASQPSQKGDLAPVARKGRPS